MPTQDLLNQNKPWLHIRIIWGIKKILMAGPHPRKSDLIHLELWLGVLKTVLELPVRLFWDCWAPSWEFVIYLVMFGAWYFAVLISSQAILMSVQGPHFENCTLIEVMNHLFWRICNIKWGNLVHKEQRNYNRFQSKKCCVVSSKF